MYGGGANAIRANFATPRLKFLVAHTRAVWKSSSGRQKATETYSSKQKVLQMSQTKYLRNRAETLRNRANDKRKTTDEIERDQLIFAARQLDIAADEIDAGFHIDDEEDV